MKPGWLVSVVTRLLLGGGSGVRIQQNNGIFTSRPTARLTTACVGKDGTFPGVMRPDYKVDHSPSCSAEVKNEWTCNSAPPGCLHFMDRDNFNFFIANIIIL
jgi:hypothetical protein